MDIDEGNAVASIRKLPSGRYRVRWREADGRERGATSPTKKAALELKAKVEVESFRGMALDPSAGKQAFGDYLQEVLAHAHELRPATRSLYETEARRHIIPRIGGRAVGALTPADMRRFYSTMVADGVGVPTIAVCHRLCSRALAQAVRDGLIPTNPVTGVRPPRADRKPPRILTFDEVADLIVVMGLFHRHLNRPGVSHNTAHQNRESLRGDLQELHEESVSGVGRLFHAVDFITNVTRLRTGADDIGMENPFIVGPHDPGDGYEGMVVLGAFAGLRFGEVAALRHDSFDFSIPDNPKVRITHALNRAGDLGPPKTKGSVRTVRIPPFVVPLLEQVRDRRAERRALLGADAPDWLDDGPNPLVFQSPRGGPIAYTRWRSRVWNRAIDFLEWDDPPGFHDLRHTCAAWLLEEPNPNLKKIQHMLGHTSIKTTMDIYGHLINEEDEGALLSLSGG